MRVEYTDAEIRIYDGDTELVGWTEQEWIDEPQVVFSIVNAAVLAHTNPDELRRILNR